MKNKLDKISESRAEYSKKQDELLGDQSFQEFVFKSLESLNEAIKGLKKALNVKENDLDQKSKEALAKLEAVALKNSELETAKEKLKTEIEEAELEEEQKPKKKK